MDSDERQALGRLGSQSGLFDPAWYAAREQEWAGTAPGIPFEEFLCARPDLEPERRTRLVEMINEVRAPSAGTLLYPPGKSPVPGAAVPAAPQPALPDLVGTRLGGCEILRPLGRGGMGAVYEGRHLALQKRVAVKVLAPHLLTDPTLIDRFRREAQSTAQIEHPNVVQVLNVGEERGLHFLVMQFIEGESLGQRMRRGGRLPVDEALRIAHAVALALAHAHRCGIVHRDVKPDNILCAADGSIKVTDFGLAKLLAGQSELSQSGLIIGTPSFIAPEQCAGAQVDGRADQYALGVTLYFLLTGKPPFSGDTPIAVMYKHMHETPTPVRLLNPAIPVDVAHVLERALAKSVADRYPSMEEFAQALDQARRGGGSSLAQAAEPTVVSQARVPAAGASGAAGVGPADVACTPPPVPAPTAPAAACATVAPPAPGPARQVHLALMTGNKGCQVTLALSLGLLLFVGAKFTGVRMAPQSEAVRHGMAKGPEAHASDPEFGALTPDPTVAPPVTPPELAQQPPTTIPRTVAPDPKIAGLRVEDAIRELAKSKLDAYRDLKPGRAEAEVARLQLEQALALGAEAGTGFVAGPGNASELALAFEQDLPVAAPAPGGDPSRARDRVAWLHAARENFVASLRLDPTHAEAHLGLAVAQHLLGDETAALATLSEGIARVPGDLDLLRCRARVLLRSGDSEAAARDLAAAWAAAGTAKEKRAQVLACIEELRKSAATEKCRAALEFLAEHQPQDRAAVKELLEALHERVQTEHAK